MIPASVRARWHALDPEAAPWVEGLAALVDDVLRDRHLELDGEPAFGGTSAALPVLDGAGRELILKLVSPIADPAKEMRALKILAGHGVVDLCWHDPERHVLLLERLPGPTLEDPADVAEAVAICGRIAARIAAVRAPEDVPRLSDGAPAWQAQLAGQHQRAMTEGRALPDHDYRAADEVIASLAAERCTQMTHGDLSLSNVMRRRDGSWTAIDPALLAGPAENEAHTVLRTIPRAALPDPGEHSRVRELLRIFCEDGGLDVELALSISRARFVASFYWESEHGADRDEVAGLRAATVRP